MKILDLFHRFVIRGGGSQSTLLRASPARWCTAYLSYCSERCQVEQHAVSGVRVPTLLTTLWVSLVYDGQRNVQEKQHTLLGTQLGPFSER